MVGRDRARLDDTAHCIEQSGGRADVLVADVRTPSYFGELDALATTVDVVVHNASAYAPFALSEGVADEEFANVYATVVDGARRLVQHVLPGMKARRFGRIVCVGSMAGELGGAGQAPYAIAKAALVGLIRTVAVEAAAYGVTANVVQPGLIDTERVAEAIDPQVRERLVRGVPAAPDRHAGGSRARRGFSCLAAGRLRHGCGDSRIGWARARSGGSRGA